MHGDVRRFACTQCGACCNRSPEVELSEAAALADLFVFRLMFRIYERPRAFAGYLACGRSGSAEAFHEFPEHGASEVNMFVTHALFSDRALEQLGACEDIARIVVTDTIPIDARKRPDNMTVLSVSGLLAEAIMNVFSDESVSGIFGAENQLF